MNAEAQIYKDPNSDFEMRVEDLTGRMTLDEKLEMLSGDPATGFDTRENKRLGIPPFRMADGPLGVRWEKATAFPCGAAMAATWDTALVARFAKALAEEAHARGRNMLLGPCVNIHRFPAGGRNFESYGEDPWLASRMAVSYIRSLQQNGVIACVKHFALNNQEWRRTEVDVIADERTMREIYLPAFEAAVNEAGVYTVMSAYNKVNGWWCSENAHLLNDILKKEWGFRGLVVSDWVSTHSTVNAANHGLDLEMPFADVFTPGKLKKALADGSVSEATINDKVKRNLRVKFLAGLFDRAFPSDTTVLTGESHRQLALACARESAVLLKNDGSLLPLDRNRMRKIAVTGPNAAVARTGGGGSSRVTPFYSISPLQAIRARADKGTEVVYAPGALLRSTPVDPIGTAFLRTPDRSSQGLQAAYFGQPKPEGSPVVVRIDPEVNFNWEDDPPAPGILKDKYSVRWSGWVVPPVTRTYTFYTASDDGVRLFVNGQRLVENWNDHGATVDSGKISLIAGQEYELTLEFYENGGSALMILGWDLPSGQSEDHLIDEAVAIARDADVALVFAGTSDSFESEGFDRVGGLRLPENQDALIRAVAAVNPRTVVVLNTGTPVVTDAWLAAVPSLIEAFFSGQEGGNAIADILFGIHNPSAKLPFSFIRGEDQSPAWEHYMDESLKAPYSEGIFTGYRYLERNKLVPAFPFGHGLSYTSFAYSDMTVQKSSGNNFEVKLKVRNTGRVKGSEVVQLYVSATDGRAERPVKELKGFAKAELEPGEQVEIRILLNDRSFSIYDPEMKAWRIDAGQFMLLAGSSSADIRLKKAVSVDIR